MKTLLIGVVVCSLGNAAFGNPGFAFPGGPIAVNPGDTFTVELDLVQNVPLGLGGYVELGLNLGITGGPGVSISNVVFDGDSSYILNGNLLSKTLNPANDAQNFSALVDLIDPDMDGFGKLATITLTVASIGNPEPWDVALSTTNINGASYFVDGNGNVMQGNPQPNLAIHVTPEPATMLLLALTLPFLRRRSA